MGGRGRVESCIGKLVWLSPDSKQSSKNDYHVSYKNFEQPAQSDMDMCLKFTLPEGPENPQAKNLIASAIG